MEFYKENIERVIKEFNSDLKNGLNESKIKISRQKFGLNVLKATNSIGIFKIIFRQFISPLVLILIVASAVSFYLQQFRDGSILISIVILNAIIGFYQEWKSENILSSLQHVV